MTPEELLESLPMARRADAVAQMRAQGITVSDAYLPMDPAKLDRLLKRDEKHLLGQVEGMLEQRGYRKLTAKNVCLPGDAPRCGYYLHLNECRRNQMLLDVLILGRDGRYLMIELKVRPAWRPGQQELIAQGYGELANSLTDAIDSLNMWESQRLL